MMNFRSISLIHFDKCFHGKCRTVSAQIIIVVRLQTSKNDLLQQYSQITNMALLVRSLRSIFCPDRDTPDKSTKLDTSLHQLFIIHSGWGCPG